MFAKEELWEKAATDQPITREDLGIMTPSSPDGLNVLPEGFFSNTPSMRPINDRFDFFNHFSIRNLEKQRIKSLYNIIKQEIIVTNSLGKRFYAFDYPNTEVPNEVIEKLKQKGIKCKFCEETKHWHFSW